MFVGLARPHRERAPRELNRQAQRRIKDPIPSASARQLRGRAGAALGGWLFRGRRRALSAGYRSYFSRISGSRAAISAAISSITLHCL